MGWSEFFLLCLTAGFLFSVLSVFSGAVHLPHFHFHLGGHGHAHGGKAGAFSPSTIAAFLLWFGAAGYLLGRFAGWRLLAVVAVAAFCGIMGATIVFLFFARVLIAGDRPLDPADYELVGVLGQLSTNVRPDGTGEMIIAQQGRRCGIPVRSESGALLERGVEVVVTRHENGIAYVRSWREMQSKF